MKYKLNKMYAIDGDGGSGAGGNTEIKVEYTLVDKLIEEMTEEINNALSIIKAGDFSVKSYIGSSTTILTEAIKAIINTISSLEKPLTSLLKNFEDIKASYKTTESDIQTAANKVLAQLNANNNTHGGGGSNDTNVNAIS